jgi:hypothetical protein
MKKLALLFLIWTAVVGGWCFLVGMHYVSAASPIGFVIFGLLLFSVPLSFKDWFSN